MMFWLGVTGAVLGAIYLVIIDNKDDFWIVKGGFLEPPFLVVIWCDFSVIGV